MFFRQKKSYRNVFGYYLLIGFIISFLRDT